ncbi:hypothetical protein [Leeuwenhoekiella parthenopeia]|uniref:Transmembrane protein n=1 Tax=Leeuwenhoekiella parthenopeia TaxID=2890320 RepID=A0ABS8GXA7_9FLAO|nr:hypothetical protein [Leeuwenhoekiella parthenopeia]MCC4213203.1 hypothetical protein [Leeuwenhoekiella parthenopeia]
MNSKPRVEPFLRNHKFYTKTPKAQNKFLLALGFLAFAVLLVLVVLSIYTGIYFIAILGFAIILSLIAPFFDVPSLKKSGKMIYYAPLFITEKPKDGLIKIHGGTLFDYYFAIDRRLNGRERTAYIMYEYLNGLLALIEAYKDQPQLRVQGTSYIINERTAKKLGFKIGETNGFQKLILSYNYFNILVSSSIAKNKLSFPKLSNTKTFEAQISDLALHKAHIEKLRDALKHRHPQKLRDFSG